MIAEFGLFGRFDAVNILKKVTFVILVTSCSEDHSIGCQKIRNIEKIIFEKTSSLLNSNIVVAKQNQMKLQNV